MRPTGTITFLFTDIEGSTRLWETHPEPMRRALVRHDALLRAVIERHDGFLVKTTGDGVLAAFGRADDALEAILAIQCAVAAEPWEADAVLKVRAALHTGPAELRDDDYFGPTLNRAARLMSIGYGAQTLISESTAERVRAALPGRVSLRDMGLHRLKDLARPERVFQVLHPDLPEDFPPLKSLNATPNNLPQQISTFVGRAREIGDVKALLESTRLVTLTGSGGAGKTRLSLQAAAEALESFADGVWFVELAGIADPELVPKAIADTMGVREAAGQSMLTTLVGALKDRQSLLVIDNCEHLIGAVADTAETLLRQCSRLKILASSRERLNIAGESAYRVPSLSLPDPRRPVTVESLEGSEGARLFIDRALSHQNSFAVTSQNAPALASICRRLDGIPLAIELAAARVRSLTVDEIDRRLDNRFRLLTSGDRTALPRQQTLRALIDWSYDLLSDTERVTLHRLSVFVGGWTLEAAEAVVAGGPVEDWEVLDLLTGLTDKSLVLVEETNGTMRYRMLESVRQYAAERLEQSGQTDGTRRLHRDFLVALTDEGASKLMGPEQVVWSARLEAEQGNLRAALDFCRDDPGGAAPALRLAASMQLFWPYHGHFAEGKRRYEEVLARPLDPGWEDDPVARTARTHCLTGAGNIAYLQGDYDQARRWYEQAREIYERAGDRKGLASALGSLGNVAQFQGDVDAALDLFRRSLAINRALGNPAGEARNLTCLCSIHADLAQYDDALVYIEQAIALHQRRQDALAESNSRSWQGVVLTSLGRYDDARKTLGQAQVLAESVGNQVTCAAVLGNLGAVAAAEGNWTEARRLYGEAFALYREHGNRRNCFLVLNAMSQLLQEEGRLADAVQVFAASTAIREALGSTLPAKSQPEFDALLAEARASLGEATFEALWREGYALSLDDAFALSQRPPDGSA